MSKSIPLVSGEQAWQNFLSIQEVLVKRYPINKRGFQDDDLCQAVCRLGHAVLTRHGLEKREFRSGARWEVKLHPSTIQTLPLSTVNEMVSAEITVWENAIEGTPDMPVGHDSWVSGSRGRTAAYRTQPSLQQVLKENYFKIEAIVNTTPEKALTFLDKIKAEANKKAVICVNSEETISEINASVVRLERAVRYKYLKEDPEGLSTKELDAMDLYDCSTMLDAKISLWEPAIPPFTKLSCLFGRSAGYAVQISVREAFRLIPKPLARATTLESVEKAFAE